MVFKMFNEAVHMVKYVIVINRLHEAILFLKSLKCYFSYLEKPLLNLSSP